MVLCAGGVIQGASTGDKTGGHAEVGHDSTGGI